MIARKSLCGDRIKNGNISKPDLSLRGCLKNILALFCRVRYKLSSETIMSHIANDVM